MLFKKFGFGCDRLSFWIWIRFESDRLKDNKEPQKRRKLNELINAHVPRDTDWRGKLVPKASTIKSICMYKVTETEDEGQHGLAKLVMIGKIFNGNEDLFNRAEEAGQVWEIDGNYKRVPKKLQ